MAVLSAECEQGSAGSDFDSLRANRLVGDIDIPSKPSILRELDSLDDDLGAYAGVIALDPALSAAVIKVINSAWFALPNQVHNIDQAVMLLGLQNTRTVVRAVCLHTITEKIKEPKLIARFWRSSLNTAICAATLSKFLHLGNVDLAYACGLFHNCALPILSCHHQNMSEVIHKAYLNEQGKIQAQEQKTINISRAEVGARLAKSWGMPEPIPDVILNQHAVGHLDLSNFSQVNHLLIILKLAEEIANSITVLSGVKAHYEWCEIKQICFDYAALTEPDFDDLREICNIELENSKNMHTH